MRLVGSCRTSSDRNVGHYGRPGRDRVRVEERQDPLDAGMAVLRITGFSPDSITEIPHL